MCALLILSGLFVEGNFLRAGVSILDFLDLRLRGVAPLPAPGGRASLLKIPGGACPLVIVRPRAKRADARSGKSDLVVGGVLLCA